MLWQFETENESRRPEIYKITWSHFEQFLLEMVCQNIMLWIHAANHQAKDVALDHVLLDISNSGEKNEAHVSKAKIKRHLCQTLNAKGQRQWMGSFSFPFILSDLSRNRNEISSLRSGMAI